MPAPIGVMVRCQIEGVLFVLRLEHDGPLGASQWIPCESQMTRYLAPSHHHGLIHNQ